MKRYLALALGVLLLAAPGAFAQIRTGNIYGTASDAQGGVLPGVTVTLSGDMGTRTAVTSSQGEFRFLALDSGRYTLTLSLAGFSETVREIVVTTGENVNLPLTLKVAGVTETVEVMGETPLVDVKKRGTSTTMITDELQKMPNARDPWGVLKNVPGVTLDRVNIAGNENGQQANAGGQGLDRERQDVERRRPRGDRHDRDRRLADLLRLRRLPGDRGHDRRRRPPGPGGGHRHQPRHQARHQQVPRQRPGLPHPRRPAVEQPARRARGRPAAREPRRELPRQGRPHPADHRLRLRPRRPDPQGHALVLRELGQAGHPPRAPRSAPRTRRSSPPTTRSSTGRPPGTRWSRPSSSTGRRRSSAAAPAPASTSRPPSSGTRRTPTRRTGPTACGSSRSTRPSRPTSSCRRRPPTTTPASALFSRDQEQSYTYDYVQGETVGAYYDYFPVRPQKDLNADGSYFVAGPRGQPRAEVRLRLPRDHDVHELPLDRATSSSATSTARPTGRPGSTARAARARSASTSTSTWATCSPGTGSPSTSASASTSRRPRTRRPRRPRTRPSPTGSPRSSTRATRTTPSTGRTSRRGSA